MANLLKGFLDNVFKGTLNPKGSLADYQHAARLYVDDSFRLAPHQKFLYHVSFNINSKAAVSIPNFNSLALEELNMLVKQVDLPKYTIATETKNQYNRKRKLQTGINYDPIQMTFHDDNYGITTAMWELYYRYYFRDGNYGRTDITGAGEASTPAAFNRGNYTEEVWKKYKYGMDADIFRPFFDSIQIYQMGRKRYTCYTLVNPIITQWAHDTLNNASSDVVGNNMTVEYETVFYSRGPVVQGSTPKGFGNRHYDRTPSPISLAGGGTTSLFGTGGIFGGIFGLGTSPFSDIEGSNSGSPASLLKRVIQAGNAFKNFKKLNKEGLRQEGFNILTAGIGSVAQKGFGGISNTVFPKDSSESVTKGLIRKI
jgi:hypothetical protein